MTSVGNVGAIEKGGEEFESLIIYMDMFVGGFGDSDT
jgi:hypothetical protein